MTQEEVDLIYDYLHENYRYKDGQLLRIKDSKYKKGKIKGTALGSFFYQGPNCPRIRCTLYINGKNYTKNLSHLIYLFHHKCIPSIVIYKDENPTNCRIENLKEGDRVLIESKKDVRGWNPVKQKNGKIRYRITLEIGKKEKIHFGSCETADEARFAYDFAKNIYVSERFDSIEIKKRVMQKFPHLKMKLKIENKHGFSNVYKRGNRFVARYNNLTSTHDTPEEAYHDVMRMKNGDFERTNRLKNSDMCSKPGCDGKFYALNLCCKHYHSYKRKNNQITRPNKTGFTGVKFDKGRYAARYKSKHIGSFTTPEEAHQAYLKAKNETTT